MRDIGYMRHLVEAPIYIPVKGAERGDDDKQQEHEGASAPIGRCPDRIRPVARKRFKMIGYRHRASVHITR
jgi:hypothetical protein